MMKNYLLSCVVLVLGICASTAVAQENFVLDEQTMRSEVKNFIKNSPEYQELVRASM